MDNTISEAAEALSKLLEALSPAGPTVHTITVDYMDASGKDYHDDFVVAAIRTENLKCWMKDLLNNYAAQGRRVGCICEQDSETVTVHYFDPEAVRKP